jgi:hypothetical protein
LRGIKAELNGGLIGGLSEVSQEVADFLLAGVDDLARRSRIDGSGDILAKSLETLTQLFQKILGGNGRFEGHGLLLSSIGNVQHARPPRPGFPLSLGAPERFATPTECARRVSR